MNANGWLLVVLAAVLQSGGNLLMRMGMDRAGGFQFSFSSIRNLLIEPVFMLGGIIVAVSIIIWLRVMASQPLHLAYPMMVTISFVIVTTGAAIILREHLTLTRMTGMLIILAGIALLNWDNS